METIKNKKKRGSSMECHIHNKIDNDCILCVPKKRATIQQINNALKTMDQERLELFYINRVLTWDKRSINEIIKESKTHDK
jgi:hypothetical protein